MARNMETLILLLDVSPSMHPHLSKLMVVIKDCINQKLLFTPKDEVALIVIGSDETNNEVNAELGGGYENVAVLRTVKRLDVDIFSVLQEIRGGRAAGDFVNGSIVALDAMMKARGRMKKGNKRIWLITDSCSPLEQPAMDDESMTMKDQIDQVAKQLVDQGIKLEVLLNRLDAVDGHISGLVEENEAHLNRLVSMSRGDIQKVTDVGSFLNKIKARVSPTTSFRGELELTPHMKIKIWIYKKTMEQSFPRLGVYSNEAPFGDPTATRQAKISREYKLSTDADVTVPTDLLVRAYQYGPQIVPISHLDREALMFQAEKGFKLMGFVSREEIPRHYFMSDVSIVIPEPGEEKAVIAVSALARALHSRNKAAIVRFKLINRENQGVTMGILTPCLVEDPTLVDAFYLNTLPFSEDIREAIFPSLTDRPMEQQPSVAQKEAALRLVQSMNLSPRGNAEEFRPDDTPNPVLQRYYRFVQQKYLDSEAPVPPLDPNLRKMVESPPLKEAMAAFKAAFPLVPSDKKSKAGRRFWNDRVSDGPQEAVLSEVVNEAEGMSVMVPRQESEIQGNITLESLTRAGPPESVGSYTPVEDFKAMMDRRDGDQWVQRAIVGMKKVIYDLLEKSFNGNMYSKALTALVALREGCVLQQEPGDFNDFLRNLTTHCLQHKLEDFWQLVAAEKITLISASEAPDSDVSEEEAKRFLERTNFTKEGDAQEEAMEDDMEHLLSAVE